MRRRGRGGTFRAGGCPKGVSTHAASVDHCSIHMSLTGFSIRTDSPSVDVFMGQVRRRFADKYCRRPKLVMSQTLMSRGDGPCQRAHREIAWNIVRPCLLLSSRSPGENLGRELNYSSRLRRCKKDKIALAEAASAPASSNGRVRYPSSGSLSGWLTEQGLIKRTEDTTTFPSLEKSDQKDWKRD